jgi:predicted O-linked N-acetylglucosamine transferase (SPINDLY family)
MLRALFNRLFGGAEPASQTRDVIALTQDADRHAREGRLHAALGAYRAALALDPAALDAQLGLGNVMVDLWMPGDAVAAYERALEIAPHSTGIRSAVLFHRHYAARVDAGKLFEAHRQAGAQLMAKAGNASPARPQLPPLQGRRLRIGYVSPNFSRHSVGYFIEPVIRHHDREKFEIFCYYAHDKSDDTTARLRTRADHWRDIPQTDGAEFAQMVRADGIDVLVDLAGHSKSNRLAGFAHRPAPLQITWLGYPDTTGLPVMDARITDAIADPVPQSDAFNSERLLRIAGGFLCYQPPSDSPPVGVNINAPSVVVFGSFNNIAKLTAGTLRLWCEILDAIPGSRLVLKSASLNFTETADRVIEAFEQFGIAGGRIDIRGWVARREQHLALYEGIDIALDTYPYNGTTTTCEALWMGVPVVTRAGDTHMSRVGASLLHAAGLDDLVTHDGTDYVETAVALAGDEARRRELRSILRQRLEQSTLLDHAGFTRRLEQAYLVALTGVTSKE